MTKMNQDFQDEDLDFWIDNRYNVLFVGPHGTGKTTRIIEAFERKGLRYQYFSAATMDPWVDFIGVPKEVNGSLELIRPKVFANDEVEAIILDEFNRSSKKTRNAVMELIQFRSINGKVFKNLKVIWAAINPDDEEKTYDVEALDPAQRDRFHFQVEVDPTPNYFYFEKVYGAHNAKAAIEWWRALEEKQREFVSPRRLDYALEIFTKGGNIRHVLYHKSLNVTNLISTLKRGSIVDRLDDLMTTKDIVKARDFLRNENNYNAAMPHILERDDFRKFFLSTLTDEKLTQLINTNEQVKAQVVENFETFKNVIKEIAESGSSQIAFEMEDLYIKNDPYVQVANDPAGSLFITKKDMEIRHDPKNNVTDFIAQCNKLRTDHPDIVKTLKDKKAAYEVIRHVPFNLVSDDTQVMGNKCAKEVISIVHDILQNIRKDSLAKMDEIPFLMNHVLFYMATFQQVADSSEKVQHDHASFMISNAKELMDDIEKINDTIKNANGEPQVVLAVKV